MYQIYSISKRLIAQILLLSLFLQNCLNPPTAPIPSRTIKQINTKSSAAKNNQNKYNIKFDFTYHPAIDNPSIKDDSLILKKHKNSLQLTNQHLQKPGELSTEILLPINSINDDSQPINNQVFSSKQFALKEQSLQKDDPQISKKNNFNLQSQKIIASQKLAKKRRELDKLIYEKAAIANSEPNPKNIDDIPITRDTARSELLQQLVAQIFITKDDYKVSFNWEDGKCTAIVEENLSTNSNKKHKMPVYLLPGLTWEKVASMSETEQKYYTHVVLPKNNQKAHILIGKMGIMGGGKTPLNNAIKNNNIEQVKELIAAGVDINAKGEYDETPLDIAVRYTTDIELIKLLLDAGASKEAQGWLGYTPLQVAVYYNKIATLKLLIDLGCDRNVKDKYGNSLLHIAVEEGHIEIVRLLIDAMVDLNLKNNTKDAPLHIAVKKGNMVLSKLLLDNGANVNIESEYAETPLHIAVQHTTDLEVIKLLLDAGASEEAQGWLGYTPLHHAIYHNKVDVINLLISLGYDQNIKDKNGDAPLHLALKRDNIQLIKLLIQLGCDKDIKNKNGDAPLHLAVEKDNIELINLLIRLGCDKNIKDRNGDTPLHLAVKKEKFGIIRSLVGNGADLNEKNSEGYMPLHLVFVPSAVNISSLCLINLDRYINARKIIEKIPTHTEIYSNQRQIIDYLIASGAYINATDGKGNTPLQLAIHWNSEEIVKHLISLGADVNFKNGHGTTPLHRAVSKLQKREIINCLISYGADINATDKDGNTPLHMAVSEDNIQEQIEIGLDFQELIKGLTENMEDDDCFSDKTVLECILKNKLEILHELAAASAIDRNITNNLRRSPIDVALENSNKELSKKMLSVLGIKINDKDNDGNTLLHLSILKGDLERTKYFIELGANLDIKNKIGLTPIDLASTNNHLDYIRTIFLIQNTDINALGEDGSTHLHRAVERADKELVNNLIELGANVNAKDKDGKTPLHITTKKGYTNLALTLIKANADLHVVDKKGLTPLDTSSKNNNLDILQHIFQAGADINALSQDGFTHLYRATQRGDHKLIYKLIELGADIHAKDGDGNTIFHLAAKKNYIELAIALFKAGAHPDEQNNKGLTPIDLGGQAKNSELLVALFESGVQINLHGQDGSTYLNRAIKRGDKELITYLIKCDANVNIQDRKEVSNLSKKGRLEKINNKKRHRKKEDKIHELDKRPKETEVKYEYDMSPLHLAIQVGYREIAMRLVKAGADLHLKNQASLTPIDLVSVTQRLDWLEEIFSLKDELAQALSSQKSIDDNQRDGTHLYRAASRNDIHLAKKLIELGADPNMLAYYTNETPLHIVARRANIPFGIVLIQAGANLCLKNRGDMTPLEENFSFRDHLYWLETILRAAPNINIPGTNRLTPLHIIIQMGYIELAKWMVEKSGANVYAIDDQGENCLHKAAIARQNGLELTDWLLGKNLDINARNINGSTPIHKAMYAKGLPIAKRLVESGVDVSLKDDDDATCLHKATAAQSTSLKLINWLVRQKLDINAKDKNGITPFHFSLEGGHEAVAQRLIELGAYPHTIDKTGATSLHKAAAAKTQFTTQFIDWLLQYEWNVNAKDKYGFTPLHIAAHMTHTNGFIEQLVVRGSNLDVRDNQGFTPLQWAAFSIHASSIGKKSQFDPRYNCIERSSHTYIYPYTYTYPYNWEYKHAYNYVEEAIKQLGNLGADINIRHQGGKTLLHWLVTIGCLRAAKTLLELGADPNVQDEEGCTPLHFANHYTAIDLVHFGAKVHIQNINGNTPFELAFDNIKHAVRELPRTKKTREYLKSSLLHKLIKATGGIHMRDQEGLTHLDHVAAHGKLSVAKYLVELGADIHARDSNNQSPLHKAIQNGQLKMAQWLVSLGADLKIQDVNGATCLHYAARSSQSSLELITWLVNQGLSVNVKDCNGLTPLHIAVQNNNVIVAEQLLGLGAVVDARDNHQMTPLHVAARQGHAAVAIPLLRAGANLQAQDDQNHTAFYYGMQHGKLEFVEVISFASSYKLHANRAAIRARKQIRIPKQLNEIQNHKKGESLVDKFLVKYPARLNLQERIDFNTTIAPILKEHLIHASQYLQRRIIQYFKNQGSFYLHILEHCAIEEWITESLILDISKDALNNGDELGFNKFKKCLQTTTQHYDDENRDKLLMAIKEKQRLYMLDLSTVCDVLTYLTPFKVPQALKFIQLTDPAWLSSLRSAWIHEQTKRLQFLTPSQHNRVGYALGILSYKPELVDRFITGLQEQKVFSYIEDFFAFLINNPVSEATLLTSFYQKPSPIEASNIQAWKRYIACELLKNKLTTLFPNHVDVLASQIGSLLKHAWLYEEINNFLGNYLIESAASPSTDAQRLTNIFELLIEYQPKESICKESIQIIQQKPSSVWEEEIHQRVIDATFPASHERNVEEIIEYITEQSPNSNLSNQKDFLQTTYQDVIAAYRGPSKIFAANKKPIYEWTQEMVTAWAIHLKNANVTADNLKNELIAVVKRSAELHHKYSPRATQLLSLLTFLNPHMNKGRLAQINTGEGKSLIVAMLAAIHALQGKKVDVVTTSIELSKPEVTKQQGFFNMLGLTVAENSERIEPGNPLYLNDIIYGVASNFQRDILRTQFKGENIRSKRGYDIIIVDEVDNMLFDNRNYKLLLSEGMPAMHHLEVVLANIYHFVSYIMRHLVDVKGKTYFISEDFKVNGEEITTFAEKPLELGDPIEDKEAFITELTESHFSVLLRKLESQEQSDFKNYKNTSKELISVGEKFKRIAPDDNKKQQALEEQGKQLKEKLDNQPWQDREAFIELPQHLQDFSRKQIKSWARSAMHAICFYKKELHYDVVDGEIVPIDYDNTGVLQHNTVWGDGLAQMLQIKEGLKVKSENVSTNFISNPGFFKYYGSNIYGLTGTLGNQTTQDFLSEIYGVDMVVIPPYQHTHITAKEQSKHVCKELPAIVVDTEEAWSNAVCKTVLSKVRNKRAVLVICKYIEQVKRLAKCLEQDYDRNKIFLYTGQEKFNKTHIDTGEIILATNIAGRGTDITTSVDVEKCGGMHVCVTFLPENYRIEKQNIGRTARQGKKGTAQLIIHHPRLTNIDILRTIRDLEEAEAINNAKRQVGNMLFHDALFQRFCALESELLPDMTESERLEKAVALEVAWNKIYEELLNPHIVSQSYKQTLELRIQNIVNEFSKKITVFFNNSPQSTIDKLPLSIQCNDGEVTLQINDLYKYDLERTQRKLTEAIRAVSHRLIVDKETFKKQSEQQILGIFCKVREDSYPADVIQCFLERRSLDLKNATLATKYSWGKYERKGLEERWGLWFHHADLHGDTINTAKVLKDFECFCQNIKYNASNDALICNPYYFIRKGNSYLYSCAYNQAVSNYNRAISTDATHSLNAYYNKAWALLRYKPNNNDLKEARRALKEAKVLVTDKYQTDLGTFNALVGEAVGTQPLLLQHTQHQLDILKRQEQYIDAALEQLYVAKQKEWTVEVKDESSLKDVFKDVFEDHEEAIYKASLNGLDYLFKIEAKKPYPLKAIFVLSFLGVLQIVTGILLVVCTGGIGIKLGETVINEGIADLMAAGKAATSGHFDWKEWGLQKGIRILTSLLGSIINTISNKIKFIQKLKDKVGLGTKTAQAAGEVRLSTDVGQQGLRAVTKQVSLAFGKTIMKEMLTSILDDVSQRALIENIEQHIEESVLKKLEDKIGANELMQKAFAVDLENNNNVWQAKLTQEGMTILTKQNHWFVVFLKGLGKSIAQQALNEVENGIRSSGTNHAAAKAIIFRWVTKSTYMTKALYEVLTMVDQFFEEFRANVYSKYETEINQAHGIIKQQTVNRIQGDSHEKLQQETAPTSLETAFDSNNATNVRTGQGTQHSSEGYVTQNYQIKSVPKTNVSKHFTNIIKDKITSKIQNDIVHPVTQELASWSIEEMSKKVTESTNKAVEAFRDRARTHRLGKELAEEKTTEDAEVQTTKIEDLLPAVQQRVTDLLIDGKGDITDIPEIAKRYDRPVIVRDKDGKIIDTFGDQINGNPIMLEYDPAGDGHWSSGALNKSNNVQPSGKNTCYFDAIYDQLSLEERRQHGLTSAEDLKAKHIEYIMKDAAKMEAIYQQADQMKKHSNAYMLAGGRLSKQYLYNHELIKNSISNHSKFDWSSYCKLKKDQLKKGVDKCYKQFGPLYSTATGKKFTKKEFYKLIKQSTCSCINCEGKPASSTASTSEYLPKTWYPNLGMQNLGSIGNKSSFGKPTFIYPNLDEFFSPFSPQQFIYKATALNETRLKQAQEMAKQEAIKKVWREQQQQELEKKIKEQEEARINKIRQKEARRKAQEEAHQHSQEKRKLAEEARKKVEEDAKKLEETLKKVAETERKVQQEAQQRQVEQEAERKSHEKEAEAKPKAKLKKSLGKEQSQEVLLNDRSEQGKQVKKEAKKAHRRPSQKARKKALAKKKSEQEGFSLEKRYLKQEIEREAQEAIQKEASIAKEATKLSENINELRGDQQAARKENLESIENKIKIKKAQRRAHQRAKRKETAKKEEAEKKNVNQSEQQPREVEKGEEWIEIPSAGIEEKLDHQLGEGLKVVDGAELQELSEELVAKKKQERRREKARRGKQKLPLKEDESAIVPNAGNFGESLDHALHTFINTFQEQSPTEEAIRDYAKKIEELSRAIYQAGMTIELEAALHNSIIGLKKIYLEEANKQEAVKQTKNILVSEGASRTQIQQAKQAFQRHKENLVQIQNLISKLEKEVAIEEVIVEESEVRGGEEIDREKSVVELPRPIEEDLYQQSEEEEIQTIDLSNLPSREELEGQIQNHRLNCEKDKEFNKLQGDLLIIEEKLTRDPGNEILSSIQTEQLSMLKQHDLYKKTVLLGLQAQALREEAEKKAANMQLYVLGAAEVGHYAKKEEKKAKRYEQEAKELRGCVISLREIAHCPNTPPGSKQFAASIEGAGENILDTGKTLLNLANLVIQLRLYPTNQYRKLIEKGVSGDLNLQEGFKEFNEALIQGAVNVKGTLKSFISKAQHVWESREEYLARLEALEELARKQEIYSSAFDAENYHLGQAKQGGYWTAEGLQWAFGDKAVEALAKCTIKGVQWASKAGKVAKGLEGMAEATKTAKILEKGAQELGEGIKLGENTAPMAKFGLTEGAKLEQLASEKSKLLSQGERKLHKHHILPQTFRPWFKSRGIKNIDDYTIKISWSTHLKGVHGHGLGSLPGYWNQHWADFIKANPNASPSEIFHYAEGLLHSYGLEYLPYVSY